MKYPATLLSAAATVLVLSGSVHAGNFVVTTDAGSGAGSLRAALLLAEGTVGQDDTITFQASLSGATIDLSTSGPLALSAAGRILVSAESLAQPVTINALGLERLFEMGADVELELNDLHLAEGSAPWGDAGSDGPAPTDGVAGGNGGGILNAGTLILKRCKIQFCLAGNGGLGGSKSGAGPGNPGSGGEGGKGGAIYSSGAGASVYLEDCELLDNEAGAGGAAGDLEPGATGVIGAAGHGGDGGAIACEGGSLELVRTRILTNRAGAGGEGGGNGNAGTAGTGGTGGHGGGIYAQGTAIRLQDSTFRNNTAGFSGFGGDYNSVADTRGAGGKGGDGGGLWVGAFAASSEAHVEGCLFQGNEASPGRVGGNSPGLGNGESGTDGGDGGSGGAIFVAGSAGVEWKMVNSTVILNFAGDGGLGGSGTTGGSAGLSGDAGNGGGIAFSRDGADYTATLTHLTVVSNNAGLPGGAGSPGGALGAASTGGGIWQIAGGINSGNGITLANSVVALNDAGSADNIGTFTAVGNNLTTGDPEIEALADNGGPTETVAPQLGSPLIDGGGTLVAAPTIDQRGEPRPFNGIADLGAFEGKFQPDARIGLSGNPATHRIDNYYTTTGAGQSLVLKLKGTRMGYFYLSAQNDGEIDDHLRITGSRPGNTVRYAAVRTTGTVANVTAALIAGYQIDSVQPGEVTVIQCSVKARSKKVRAKQTFVYGVSTPNAPSPDVVVANITSKKVKKKK
ncbi:MAG: hypothetical protein JNJ70_05215 [Verrucomicrobiales bacterium]|nr:hypothetical protein [Verrucomicrobiales bacterium]